MAEHRWIDCPDFEALSERIVEAAAAIITTAVEERGAALLALPGGKTPVPILEALAARDLPWDKVTALPTDERLVADDSPLCNSVVLARCFGTRGARIVPLNLDTKDVVAAAALMNTRIADLAFPMDLMWTGVGPDGHTASIIAGPDIERAFAAPDWRRIVGIVPDPPRPEAPVPRVTMTCATLFDTREAWVVITGEEKRALVEQGLREKERSSLPIGRVLAQADRPVTIWWCP